VNALPGCAIGLVELNGPPGDDTNVVLVGGGSLNEKAAGATEDPKTGVGDTVVAVGVVCSRDTLSRFAWGVPDKYVLATGVPEGSNEVFPLFGLVPVDVIGGGWTSGGEGVVSGVVLAL
jgi:hypothetical protein